MYIFLAKSPIKSDYKFVLSLELHIEVHMMRFHKISKLLKLIFPIQLNFRHVKIINFIAISRRSFRFKTNARLAKVY